MLFLPYHIQGFVTSLCFGHCKLKIKKLLQENPGFLLELTKTINRFLKMNGVYTS